MLPNSIALKNCSKLPPLVWMEAAFMARKNVHNINTCKKKRITILGTNMEVSLYIQRRRVLSITRHLCM